MKEFITEKGYDAMAILATNNKAGQALYKKMGFKVEGVKEHSLFVNGQYIDDIYMAKLI